jgi:hypothetical protein
MCIYHENVLSPPYCNRDMFICENTCQCNGNIIHKDKSTFVVHLSTCLKDFVMGNLRLGLFVSQVMAKHQGSG